MTRQTRIDQRRAAAMPLEHFPEDVRRRIEDAIAQPTPPPKWDQFGPPGSPRPLMAIVSRAWIEWHWARGIDPEEEHREKIPDHVGAAVLERDWPFCQICGGLIALGEQHLDHILPWSQGGKNTVANLRLTHDICNMRRGAPTSGA